MIKKIYSEKEGGIDLEKRNFVLYQLPFFLGAVCFVPGCLMTQKRHDRLLEDVGKSLEGISTVLPEKLNAKVITYGPVKSDHWFYRTAIVDNELEKNLNINIPTGRDAHKKILSQFKELNHKGVIPSIPENLRYDEKAYLKIISDEKVVNNLIKNSPFLISLAETYIHSEKDSEVMRTLSSRLLDIIKLGDIQKDQVEKRISAYSQELVFPEGIRYNANRLISSESISEPFISLESKLYIPSKEKLKERFEYVTGDDIIDINIPESEFVNFFLAGTEWQNEYHKNKEAAINSIQQNIRENNTKNPNLEKFTRGFMQYTVLMGYKNKKIKKTYGIRNHNEYELVVAGASLTPEDGRLGPRTTIKI